jgi:MoxR-like ATPase
LDRFFFKVDVPFPTVDELVSIANRTTGEAAPRAEAAADGRSIVAMQTLARGVPIAEHVTAYAARLVKATHPDQPEAPEEVRQFVRYGSSPRGMQAMILAGKIVALLDGRYNVAYEDIRMVATPAMRHRLILNFEAQAEGVTADQIIGALLKNIRVDE